MLSCGPARLSVLDLAPVAAGSSVAKALQNSLDLAQHVERLGYLRHWVAEHHNMPGIASSAPAVLIAHLASVTASLRLGSGGVMLPNHQPLVVAEQFGMLEALHPGRIDLGIGRAPGTEPVTAYALRRAADPSADDLPKQLAELLAYFAGSTPRITAVPGGWPSPGDLAARLERLQRPPRRRARTAVLLRPPLHASKHARRIGHLPPRLPTLSSAFAAVRDDRCRRRLRRHRRTRPLAARPRQTFLAPTSKRPPLDVLLTRRRRRPPLHARRARVHRHLDQHTHRRLTRNRPPTPARSAAAHRRGRTHAHNQHPRPPRSTPLLPTHR